MGKKKIKHRSSVNDLYDFYIVPEKLIKYKDFYFTEGIYNIANDENCFLILDIICHQKKNFNTEIWNFSRDNDNLFSLTGKSKQGFTFTEILNVESDFYFDDFTIIKKEKLLCLPSEENLY